MAYRHVSLINLYLCTKFRSNLKNFVGRRTDVWTSAVLLSWLREMSYGKVEKNWAITSSRQLTMLSVNTHALHHWLKVITVITLHAALHHWLKVITVITLHAALHHWLKVITVITLHAVRRLCFGIRSFPRMVFFPERRFPGGHFPRMRRFPERLREW